MLWSRIKYNPGQIKTHIVQHDLAKDVSDEIFLNRNIRPGAVDENYKFVIDPGGMMRLDNVYLSAEFDELEFQVKPEHIVNSLYAWEKPSKYLDKEHEGVVRVILSNLECVVLREETHGKVLCWLRSLEETGKKELKSLSSYFYDTCVFNSAV